MTRGPHSALARRLRSVRAPEEAQSEERTWGVVRRVFAERPATRRGRRLRPRLALAPVGALLVGVLALTPAGAAVHSWIDRTLGVRHARTALFSLPAPGRILVSGDSGTWTVATDGVRRRLGPWPVATWSPHGEYVAVASPDELTAVDTKGTLRWSIPRRAVALPRWFAPDGYRVAYLSGTTLRVIAGDGTGDHLLARQVAQGVAPAWQPGHRYELGYVRTGPGARETVVVGNADTRALAWSHQLAGRIQELSWSADGTRLLALTGATAVVMDPAGRVTMRVRAASGDRWRDAALSPDGRQLALLGTRSVELAPTSGHGIPRPLFTGAGLGQLSWSPDGNWLLVTWPAADQWVFLRASGTPRIVAVSRIARQFGARAVPTLDGWCCSAEGSAS